MAPNLLPLISYPLQPRYIQGGHPKISWPTGLICQRWALCVVPSTSRFQLLWFCSTSIRTICPRPRVRTTVTTPYPWIKSPSHPAVLWDMPPRRSRRFIEKNYLFISLSAFLSLSFSFPYTHLHVLAQQGNQSSYYANTILPTLDIATVSTRPCLLTPNSALQH